jgi:hypothetical protein
MSYPSGYQRDSIDKPAVKLELGCGQAGYREVAYNSNLPKEDREYARGMMDLGNVQNDIAALLKRCGTIERLYKEVCEPIPLNLLKKLQRQVANEVLDEITRFLERSK